MRIHRNIRYFILTAVSFLFAENLALADSIAEAWVGTRTRTVCLEQLKGLGNASLVFEDAIPQSYKEDDSMNGDFYWSAILISNVSAPVNVTLHCVRARFPAIEGVSKEPIISSFSELVKR